MKTFKCNRSFVYLLLASILFGSCTDTTTKSTTKTTIKTVDTNIECNNLYANGYLYQIVVIKGHEYITIPARGGIVHSGSCSCKNK